MKIRTSTAALFAAALILAACGGDTATTTTLAGADTPEPTQTTAAETTTTAAPTTTTTEAPTTTPAAASADCVVGTWELDSEAFIAQIFSGAAEETTGLEELGDVQVSHGGGAFIVTMNADGTFVGERDNWQIRLSADEGTFINTLDGEETGTWSVDGDQLTVTSLSSTIQVSFAAEVDGELQELPFGGPQTVEARELGGTGPFTCDGDTFEVTFEGGTSTFARR
jgi:hypothetical protein